MRGISDKIGQVKQRCGVIYLYVLLLAVAAIFTAGCENKRDSAIEKRSRGAARSAEEICPILVGDVVPELSLRTADGKSFSLNEAIWSKPTVLIFYRGGWCPYCSTHLGQLRDVEDEILKYGYQIIAVSPDRPEKLSESIDEHRLNYLLVSDSDMAAAKAFGIAFKLDKSTIKKYGEYGIDLYDASGEKHYSLPVPSVFVVGIDGVIMFEYVNPNYKVRLDADVLLSVVKAGQAGG